MGRVSSSDRRAASASGDSGAAWPRLTGAASVSRPTALAIDVSAIHGGYGDRGRRGACYRGRMLDVSAIRGGNGDLGLRGARYRGRMLDVSAISGTYGDRGRRGACYRGRMRDVSAIHGTYGDRGRRGACYRGRMLDASAIRSGDGGRASSAILQTSPPPSAHARSASAPRGRPSEAAARRVSAVAWVVCRCA
jgi:hypothetical protein